MLISIIGTLACPVGNYLCSASILDAIFLAAKPVFVIALLFCIIDFVKDYIKPSGKGLFGLLLGYSFSIYFFHVMIIDIIEYYWPMSQANMYLFVVVSFMVALLLPIPIAWLLKKIRCGWMIGEKSNSTSNKK